MLLPVVTGRSRRTRWPISDPPLEAIEQPRRGLCEKLDEPDKSSQAQKPRSPSWDCDTWSMPSESRVLLVSVAERADTPAVPHPYERIPRPYERIRTLGAV